MRTGRKTRLRRILRRKRIKRAIKAYGNYIAAGVLVFIVCVTVVGAAVKPTANTLPKNTPEPVQNTQTTESTVPGAGICDRRRGNSWRIYLPGSFRNQEL